MTAIQAGFTSVMMDGSLKADGKTPGDWDYNVGSPGKSPTWPISAAFRWRANLACWVRSRPAWATRRTVTVPRASSPTTSCSPIPRAVKFVKETKVDALAIAMGTSHGAYKFTRKPDGDILAMNVIEEIHRKLPNMHLVMHGSSSVPQELQDIINANGGRMKPTWGVPVSEIQRGIKNGVRKINIDTDNRMAMTDRSEGAERQSGGIRSGKYLKPAMEAMAKLCKQRLQEFNAAGQASKIKKVLTPAEMAKRYAKASSIPKSRMASRSWTSRRLPSAAGFLGNCPRTVYFDLQGL